MKIVDRFLAPASPTARLRLGLSMLESGQLKEGVAQISRAAQAGLPAAQFHLGQCYLDGTGLPRSMAEAVRWMSRAAEGEHAEAQFKLSLLCMRGDAGMAEQRSSLAEELASDSSDEPRQADPITALLWARRASANGSPEGQALLGYILTAGPEALRDEGEGERWYTASAAAGCPQGHLGLGLLHLRKQTQEGNISAVSEIQKAAAANLGDAIFLLGALTHAGIGIEKSSERAAEYYASAAESGIVAAQTSWGLALLNGDGVNRNVVLGETWLRRAGLAGDAHAAALVGHLHAKGGDLPPNFAEAKIWLERAAKAGYAGAARTLSQLYQIGTGGVQDVDSAGHWLREAGDLGSEASQVDVANLILIGRGVPGDDVRTRHWFERGAKQGNLAAAFNFGICLSHGIGGGHDEAQAVRWLRAAAEEMPIAQFWYGRMLAEGRGVTSDVAEGRAWIARASDAGVSEAQAMLGEMMVNGRGGPVDRGHAFLLFERAAESGHIGAIYALAAMLDGGYELEPNFPRALSLFRAAAEAGHVGAQLAAGRYLSRGRGGLRDENEARHWFTAALDQGSVEAARELEELDRKLLSDRDETQAGFFAA